MSDLKSVTSNPHLREKDSTQRIMLYVIISLLPATFFGIWNFGYRAAVIIAVSIIFAVLSEYIYEKIAKTKSTIGDLSAVLTGLLIALNVPSGIAWWIPALGSVFGIIVVKMLFGGLGQNFMNPALGARCFLLISFAGPMTDFFAHNEKFVDAFSSATPLASLKSGEIVDSMKMLIGTIPGTIGETSVIALVIGAIFLILMGVIDLRIPGTYILSFVVFITIFGGHGLDIDFIVAHICGGGLILGAFFMATDYVTSPITPNGKYIYGIILGVLTGLFRIFGSGAEGVSYAIIISNMMVPLIENKTVPLALGIVKEKKGGRTNE